MSMHIMDLNLVDIIVADERYISSDQYASDLCMEMSSKRKFICYDVGFTFHFPCIVKPVNKYQYFVIMKSMLQVDCLGGLNSLVIRVE